MSSFWKCFPLSLLLIFTPPSLFWISAPSSLFRIFSLVSSFLIQTPLYIVWYYGNLLHTLESPFFSECATHFQTLWPSSWPCGPLRVSLALVLALWFSSRPVFLALISLFHSYGYFSGIIKEFYSLWLYTHYHYDIHEFRP